MILIVDDDKSIRLSLGVLLRRAGHEVTAVETPEEALSVVRSVHLRLIIMDMNFSRATTGEEGLELLQKCKIFQPDTPVILITAWGSIPLAVAGMQAGAFDFITKPWNNQLLLQRVETALSLSREKAEEQVSATKFDRSGIIGKSPAITGVLETVERVASTNAPVLILGENGTGKELIAHAIHANSPRAKGPFVMVNLGGISQSLFESEMFGHRKGAFTGAVADREGRFSVADGGTIFLDEIGELDINSQVKLLRVLQEHTFEMLGDSMPRKVDVRVVCATNADLAAMVRDRTFREDLFYRINLITVTLPPLRERPEDIPLLVEHIVGKASAETGREIPEITADALDYLAGLPYPGNIRELKNLVERTLLVSNARVLTRREFQAQADNGAMTAAPTVATGQLERSERELVEAAIARSGGNMSRAAALLGISRQALYRRIEKYGIKP